jgi:hypothetical protein
MRGIRYSQLVQNNTGEKSIRAVTAEGSEKAIAARIARMEVSAGVIWIIIGVLQICGFIPFLVLFGYGFALLFVGIWNIYWAIRRFSIAKIIESRVPGIPSAYEQHLSMIILFIFINLFFGGVIGVFGCFYDLYVRSQVLQHRGIFER